MLRFPPGFLWGTATSPTQIEGHINNEWTGLVARDGRTCHPACDSYHRYAEDVQWMQKLGVNSYRMGIEWSRLQAAAGAPLDVKELARYKDQLERLRAAGIEPMVVLHHFSNPAWVNAAGGWVKGETVRIFVDYVAKLAGALRGHVRLWNTFNEPDTYALCAYVVGQFPPLKRARLSAYRKVIRNMAQAHRQICAILLSAGSPLGPVEVGFSKNWTFFEPYSKGSPWDSAMAALTHSQLNTFVLESFLGPTGAPHAGTKIANNSPFHESDANERPLTPALSPSEVPMDRDFSPRENSRRPVREGCRSLPGRGETFLGINYYGRIRFRNLTPLAPVCGCSTEHLSRLDVACDDMIERHPAGLELAVSHLFQQSRLPIYLTEHGSASADELFRERDLRDNLIALHGAISTGADVRGFYYWSLLDNFEWQFGYTKKFGLISVDFQDHRLPRTMKRLGETYAALCRQNALALSR